MRLLAAVALAPLAMAGLTGLWPNGNISRTSPELSNSQIAQIAQIPPVGEDFSTRWFAWPAADKPDTPLLLAGDNSGRTKNAAFVSSSREFCARHGLRRVYVSKWRWRCR